MKKLDIIYEDKNILVINKPAKLLTIADNKERVKTLYHEVREYLHKKNQKVFIVHRLDKDTSGIILFCKNEKIKRLLQDNWNSYYREYIALVEGHLKNKKVAITEYEVINYNKTNSLVKIVIKTGRKNQIRATMSFLGNPIIGDKKYNSKQNIFNRLALHHTKLEIINPINKKVLTFYSEPPKIFFTGFNK